MRETLEASGKAIWDSLGAERQPPAARALIVEYARLADTSDRIAGIAAGRKESWAELVYDEMGEIHIEINKVLAEQRNTQLALKTVHAELRAAGLLVAAAPVAAEAEETPLEKRRREKEERERKLG